MDCDIDGTAWGGLALAVQVVSGHSRPALILLLMSAIRWLYSFAPATLWVFWIVATAVVLWGVFGSHSGQSEPSFLVSTGRTLEAWTGAHPGRVLQHFDDGSTVLDPALSNRGERLAYVLYGPITKDASGNDDFGADLYVADADGSGARALVKHSILGETIESPLWLPGDGAIAFAIVTPRPDESADRRIEAVDVATGVRHRLVDDGDQPALMPDGRHLIFRLADYRPGRSGETPEIYDLATGELSDLPQYHQGLVYVGAFTPSPDGKQIAFGGADPSLAVPGGGSTRAVAAARTLHPFLQDFWLMSPDGSDTRRIADLAVDRPSLAWSADGTWLYAMTNIGFWRIDPRLGTYKKIGPGGLNIRIRLLPSR